MSPPLQLGRLLLLLLLYVRRVIEHHEVCHRAQRLLDVELGEGGGGAGEQLHGGGGRRRDWAGLGTRARKRYSSEVHSTVQYSSEVHRHAGSRTPLPLYEMGTNK